MDKKNLFNTPLWIVNPGKMITSQIREIKETVSLLETNSKGDPTVSGINGWRLENPHKRKDLNIVEKYIRFLTKAVLIDDLKLDVKNLKLRIHSWLNVHPNGGMNSKHHHGTSTLSGIFYIHTPSGSGNLRIYDPRPGAYFKTSIGLPLGTQICEDGTNGIFLSIEPSRGQAILFPGYLEHAVEPARFKDPEERRISIAFNIDFV